MTGELIATLGRGGCTARRDGGAVRVDAQRHRPRQRQGRSSGRAHGGGGGSLGRCRDSAAREEWSTTIGHAGKWAMSDGSPGRPALIGQVAAARWKSA